MTHWHDTMVDHPQADSAVYATGWTISGLAVLGTIVAVWGSGNLTRSLRENHHAPAGMLLQGRSVRTAR
jgi:hypothetical protein